MMELKKILDCDVQMQHEGALLIIESLPQYYALFEGHGRSIPSIVNEMFSLLGSSVSETMVLTQFKAGTDDTVAGVMASIPGPKLMAANLIDLRHLLASVPIAQQEDVKGKVVSFGGQVPPVDKEIYYLSRIAVRQDLYGSGVADDLLDAFTERNPGFPVLGLHVKRDNTRALSFYRRHGYKPSGDQLHGYLFLQKPSN
jgi:ribosomal protein S18 acetylase RimI-like enzyme